MLSNYLLCGIIWHAFIINYFILNPKQFELQLQLLANT